MAKLTRVTGKVFGETADSTGSNPEIGQFGSAKAGTYIGTTDVATIQGLSAWSNGWIDAVTPTQQFPTLPEMTGVHKVLSYQNAYLLQQGIAEWDSGTTYYTNGFCSKSGKIYLSQSDNNTNNDPESDSVNWKEFKASGYHPQIFTFQWSDHLLNDIQWLRGDTFSWQDGSVYVTAYNHLVDDITGKSLQTETIAGYTISYYLADDGHKIAPDTEETDILGLYNDTGIAWYYIIDTDNIRFKLPRDNAKHGELIEKYSSGTEWYRVYSDGWCEQGGTTTMSGTPMTQNLFKSYRDTNYLILVTSGSNTNSWPISYALNNTKTTSSFDFDGTGNYTTAARSIQVNWQTQGYISTPTNQYLSEYKYLYFYVGEYEQSAVEQTAGLNADLFNAKVDLNASNLNAQGQSLISGLPMPSDTYEAMTLGASGSTYTAPANGWFVAHGVGTSGGQSNMVFYIGDHDSTIRYKTEYAYSEAHTAIWMPVLKGDVVAFRYYNTVFTYSGASNLGLYFIYAQGSESEA